MDYSSVLNSIDSKLSDIITLLSNIKSSEYLEVLIIIMLFILFTLIERKY